MAKNYEIDINFDQPDLQHGHIDFKLIDKTTGDVLFQAGSKSSCDDVFPIKSGHVTLNSGQTLISKGLGLEFNLGSLKPSDSSTGVVIHDGNIPSGDPVEYSNNSESCVVTPKAKTLIPLAQAVEAIEGLPVQKGVAALRDGSVSKWINQNCTVNINSNVGFTAPKLDVAYTESTSNTSDSIRFSLDRPVEKDIVVLYTLSYPNSQIDVQPTPNHIWTTREALIPAGTTQSTDDVLLSQHDDYADPSSFSQLPSWASTPTLTKFDSKIPSNFGGNTITHVQIVGYAAQFHDGSWYWDSKSGPGSTDMSNEKLLFDGNSSTEPYYKRNSVFLRNANALAASLNAPDTNASEVQDLTTTAGQQSPLEALHGFLVNAGDTGFHSNLGTAATVADFVTGTSRIDFASGPAGTATNFGAASTTTTDFASIQAVAQHLISGHHDTYAFVADGVDGFLFTTGGTGTAITDAVKLTGAGSAGAVKFTDIAHGALA